MSGARTGGSGAASITHQRPAHGAPFGALFRLHDPAAVAPRPRGSAARAAAANEPL